MDHSLSGVGAGAHTGGIVNVRTNALGIAENNGVVV
jgi:hypothetical protein